jgi:hypothetical protein
MALVVLAQYRPQARPFVQAASRGEATHGPAQRRGVCPGQGHREPGAGQIPLLIRRRARASHLTSTLDPKVQPAFPSPRAAAASPLPVSLVERAQSRYDPSPPSSLPESITRAPCSAARLWL